MKILSLIALTAFAFSPLASAQQKDHLPNLPTQHSPADGVVKIYGAGGPHVAIRKVADAWEAQTGERVEVIFGPQSQWADQARKDADLLWGTSQQSITAYLEDFTEFSSDDVHPVYIRPAIIAVQPGNPKRIQGFNDLLADGISIVVTEGAGVYNTSGTGVWEDVAGRDGNLKDIIRFRKNIVAFGKGSGAANKAFKSLKADAWITWPEWPIQYPQNMEAVQLEPNRVIWRDLNIVTSPKMDPQAAKFLKFLTSDQARMLMASEGYVR